jgi:N-acetylglucosaminyldiphosphoundecaprenol N-acetyl-beta-D-mannosaminyltransferase
MAENNLNQFSILGVNISAIDIGDACYLAESAISRREKVYISTCPVSTIMESKRSEKVLTSVNCADLATPDGMPMVWVGKLLGYKNIRRVYGPELMQKICEISQKKGYRNYLYGSSPDVLSKLSDKLNIKYPNLVISGSFSPPFRKLTKDEDNKIVTDINSSNPDIVWVGLGSPKQDLWMHEHRHKINAPVMIGVGAAFDFIAGTKPQAPRWMRKVGLEWFFRLMTEPKRLWRRYLVNNTLFIWYVGVEMVQRLLRRTDK